jgi:hypothetical protein
MAGDSNGNGTIKNRCLNWVDSVEKRLESVVEETEMSGNVILATIFRPD